MDFEAMKNVYSVERPRPENPKGKIYLNGSTVWDIEGKSNEENLNIAIVGQSGKGKTHVAGCIESQSPNAIHLDPKGDFWRKTLGKKRPMGLDEQKNWTFLTCSELAGKKTRFRINVRDCGVEAVNALFPLAPATKAERDLRQALQMFFSMDPKNPLKTYKSLESIFREFPRHEGLLTYISVILDPNDDGIPLERFQHGRWCIDCHDMTPDNPSAGMFFGALLDFRGRPENTFFARERILVFVDEGDSWATRKTAVGKAMGALARKARSKNIVVGFIGTTLLDIEGGIKANLPNVFAFYAPGMDDFLRDYWEILVDSEVFFGLERRHGSEYGNCYIKAPSFGVKTEIPIHIDPWVYQEKRQAFSKPQSTYQKIDFLAPSIVSRVVRHLF